MKIDDAEMKKIFDENVITQLITNVIGTDMREGLVETPKRVVKAWAHWCGGYALKAEDILKVFEDGAESCDQMVVRKNIPIYSHCEHHLAAIFGTCTIAYIPDGKIVGLSKMDRLADMYARRLQVQERMTNQIADAMFNILKPKGVGVFINARHMCVESRGVQNQDSATITQALRGVFLTEQATREEFLALARN
jgi:GTP cyclohydrolase I